MTKANAKVLYEGFIAKGMHKNAQELLKHYPEFEEQPGPPPLTEKIHVKNHGKKSKRRTC